MSVRPAQEGARIIDDSMNTRIAVGMFRMCLGACDLDDRIDLDRVYAGYAAAKSRGHIVARTRSDDCHVDRVAERLVRKFVIVADRLEAWIGLDVAIGGRQVMYPLVVVAGSANDQQTGLAVAEFENLVRGVDSRPQRVHGPCEDAHGQDRGYGSECQHRSRANVE